MRQIIFNHYVNECRTYLSFSQRVFHGIFGEKENNAVTLLHSAHRKHAFTGKIQVVAKKNRFPARKKIALELLHQRLGHRSTRSLLAGNTANVWEDIDLRIDPDPFCT